jgi:N-acyl-phosphatidylethanolamine-hydrolysing phospholipase D
LSGTDAPLPSQRGRDGRFINPWPGGETTDRGLLDMLRWQRDRLRDGVIPDPPRDAFDVASPDIALPRSAAGELRITWVGHSTFLLQLDGVNILTDPVWSERASPFPFAGPRRLVSAAVPFPALPPIDVVVLSHDHYDHLDSATVRRLAARDPDIAWVAPTGHESWLRRRGARRIIELDWWASAIVDTAAGPLEVRAAPAQHWSRRTTSGVRRRLWASFSIARAVGRPVYFGGDSGYYERIRDIAALGPFDAVLLPIGAYEPRWFMKPAHMNPEEAVQSWQDLGARGMFVGMHWGTFRLTDEDAFEPPARTREVWQRLQLPDELLWIPRHGETRVIAPSTRHR